MLTSELKGHRTLATVVFTDCVGFSARMSVDEDHTLALIRRDLKLMKHLCESYEGRVLKSTGDGLLMCFISAVKAVECSIEIQRKVTEESAKLPASDSLRHRIGIHLADIFISETDVMGNGVNIAARLQTLADPGGICISQTVYDVVKAGLHLATRYLGPQELKNIREVVPTYSVLLQPEAAMDDPCITAAFHLEENSNHLRIKKLLLYVCRNTWESDTSKLTATDCRDLIQELLRLAPTRDRLQSFLEGAVKTLSKPDEYALIAKIILDEITKLLASLQQRPAPVKPFQREASAEPTIAFGQAPSGDRPITADPIYTPIAQELEQSGNVMRVKKLLYYVCRKRWENNAQQLDATPLPILLAELHGQAPTLERVKELLQEFVQTLSKQGEYELIANLIVSKVQKLYTVGEPALATQSAQLVSPNANQPVTATSELVTELHFDYNQLYQEIALNLEQDPNLPRMKKLMLYICRRQWEGDSTKLANLNTAVLVREIHTIAQTQEQLELALSSVVRALNKRDEYSAIARSIIGNLKSLYVVQPLSPPEPPPPPPDPPINAATDSVPVQSSPLEPLQEQPKKQEQDQVLGFFDYRLAVMKYTNPLRAKILLFAALHQGFNDAEQDWFNLRMCELDGLMRRLLTICKIYTDMEALLYSAARGLQEPEEYIQTATAVIKCFRPFYLHGNPMLQLEPAIDSTRISLDDFEETTLEISHPNDDDAFTCQLLTAPVETNQVAPLPKSRNDSTHLLIEPQSLTTAMGQPRLSDTSVVEGTSKSATTPNQPYRQPSINQDATG